ncbi:MAG: hypothetical protein ABWZ67_00715 [Solirubrobacteraceae bacterium]
MGAPTSSAAQSGSPPTSPGRRGRRRTSTPRFEVGGNLALTPGSVVLHTDVFELIRYKPATEPVHEVPLVFIPPAINKYYILDLAPGRSVVEYLVAQGMQVLLVSWRTPTSRTPISTSTPTRAPCSERATPSPPSRRRRRSTSTRPARAGSPRRAP